MRMETNSITVQPAGSIPTVPHPRVHGGFEPEYAIQHCSPGNRDWRFWDCAYTRVEADNLLAYYNRRYRSLGHEWRLAKIVYVLG